MSITGNAGTVTNGVYTTDTGSVSSTMLAAAAVTYAKIQNLNYGEIIGRNTAGAGVSTGISTSTYKSMLALTSADVGLGNVTNTAQVTSVTGTYPVLSSLGTTPTISLAFGTTSSNTWGGTQTFTNAPTLASFTGLVGANAGVTYAISTTSMQANITGTAGNITGIAAVANGGTGWASIQANAIPYGNGTTKLSTTTQGTGGQILAWSGGIPAWIATTSIPVGGNVSGTLSNLTVVTNANLSGVVTSSGNTTFFGSQTAGVLGNAITGNTAPMATSTLYGVAPAGGYVLGWNNTTSGIGWIATSTSGGGVTSISIASANGFAGSSSGGSTPALTISTSITGVLKGNGTAISAAANGTDFTLITANTCGSGHFSQVTAAGVFTCTADTGGAGPWTTSGNNIYNNNTANVGVGTSTPWANLSVGSSNASSIGTLFAVASSSATVATSTLFVINGNGNVGIGTTTPGYKFEINGSGVTSQLHISSDGTNSGAYLTTVSANSAYLSGGVSINSIGQTVAHDTTATALALTSGSTIFYGDQGLTPGSVYAPTARMTISSFGWIGIATSTPTRQLDINGSARINQPSPTNTTSALEISASTSAATTPNWEVYAGPPLAQFNAWDTGGMRAASAFGNLNPQVSERDSALVGLTESSYTAIPSSALIGVHGQSTAANTSGTFTAVYGGLFEGDIYSSGAGQVTQLAGLVGVADIETANTAATAAGGIFHGVINNAGASVTTLAGVQILTNANIGTAATNYGLLIQNQAGIGTANYSIKTGTGLVSFGDSVGVGTSTPWANLSVGSSNSATLSPLFVVASSSASVATSTLFIVNGNGNVGIGTTSPWAKLSVEAGSSQEAMAVTGSNNSYLESFFRNTNSGNSATSNLALYNDKSNLAAGNYSGFLALQGSGWTGDPITSPGSAPNSLILSATDGPLVLGSATSTTAGLVDFRTAGASRLRIDSSGNVGIGTTSPGSLLSIQGIANFTTGTTTFYGNGINIPANQCYAVGGICLSSGGSLPAGTAGQTLSYVGTTLTATSTLVIAPTQNVGIGTTTPFSSLSVSDLTQQSGTLPLFTVASTTNTTLLTVLGNGYVGIGDASPQWPLDIISATRPQLTLEDGVNAPWSLRSVGGSLYFATSSLTTFATSSVPAFTIFNDPSSTSGTIGIGSSTPWGKLSVEMGPSNSAFVVSNQGSTTPAFTIGGVNQNGRIGVGTSSPFATLSVHTTAGAYNPTLFAIGSSTAAGANSTLFSVDNTGLTSVGDSSGTGDANFQFASDVNAWSVGYKSSDKSFNIASSTNFTGTAALSIAKNGNTTIVGSLSTCVLGNATGAVSCTSDARLKTNITPISGQDALDKLLLIHGVTFNLADPSKDQKQQVGLIAQNVMQAFPQLIGSTTVNFEGTLGTYYTVDYAALVGPIISGVNLLNEYITPLSATTSALELTTASSSVSTTTPWVASFANASSALQSGVNTLADTVVHVFQDAVYAATGVFNKIFAKEVHTDKLCISDNTGETCVTKAQLDALLSGTSTMATTTTTTSLAVTLNGSNPTYLTVGSTYVEQGAVVSGGKDGTDPYNIYVNGSATATSSPWLDTSSPTTYILTYTTTDSAGTTVSDHRSVIVGNPDGTVSTGTATTTTATTTTTTADTTPPVVTLSGAATMSLNVGDTFTDLGATALDNVDGNLTSKIVETGAVDTTTAGLYTLVYSATDAAGNTGSASRAVTVVASTTTATTTTP